MTEQTTPATPAPATRFTSFPEIDVYTSSAGPIKIKLRGRETGKTRPWAIAAKKIMKRLAGQAEAFPQTTGTFAVSTVKNILQHYAEMAYQMTPRIEGSELLLRHLKSGRLEVPSVESGNRDRADNTEANVLAWQTRFSPDIAAALAGIEAAQNGNTPAPTDTGETVAEGDGATDTEESDTDGTADSDATPAPSARKRG